jgi:hypothetical protein
VNYQANTTGSAREGSFNVTGSGVTKTVTVLQATGALTLNVTPATQTIPNVSGSATYSITSNVQWTATCPALWVTIPNPTGVNAGALVVNAEANMALAARSAIITITGGGITRTVTLTQQGSAPYLAITPEGTINVPRMDGNRNIAVESNAIWAAYANQPWITFTQNEGNGDGFVYFSFNANPLNVARTAIIYVNTQNISKTLTVIQAAGDGAFVITPNTLQLSHLAGSQTVAVTSSTAWTADVPAGWYSLAPTSGGSGTTNVTINYSANTTTENRSSEVTFSNGTFYRYLELNQQKPSAVVFWNLPAGGTVTVLNGTTPVISGSSFDLNTVLNISFTINTGYYLVSFTKNGAPASQGNHTITENTVFNITLSNAYTLTLNPAPGTVTPTQINVEYGSPIGTLPVPIRTGYTYSGWRIDGITLITSSDVWSYVTDKTATTTWSANTYNVNLNMQGGTGGTPNVTVTYDAPMPTAVPPARPGYHFGGYYSAIGGGGTQYYTATMTSANNWNIAANNTTLYAHWTPMTYTLTFNPNGAGAIVSRPSQPVIYNTNIDSLPSATRLGYTHTGWQIGNTPITPTTLWTYINSQPADAQWSAATYTLILHPGTGTYTGPNPMTVTYGSSVTIPDATQPGCIFDGWYIDGVKWINGTIWTFTTPTKEAFAKFKYPVVVTNQNPSLGVVTSDKPSPYDYGDNATYTVTPNLNARIARILVDGALYFTGTDGVWEEKDIYFENIQAAHTIVVSFVVNCYSLNKSGLGVGVDLIMTLQGSTIPISCAPHGSNVNINIVASGCAEILGIEKDGVIQPINNLHYPINNVNGPLPVFVITTDAQVFTINATPLYDPMGSISPSGVTSYYCGETPTYTFIPAPGHQVKAVFVDGISLIPLPANNQYTFSGIEASHTIHVEFEEITVHIIQFGPDALQNAGGVVYPTYIPGALYYIEVEHGTSVPFSIVPVSGYVIDKVYVDGEVHVQATQSGIYTFSNVIASHTIYATFKPITHVITATTDGNGSILPGGSVTVNHGASQAFQIFPNTGYDLSAVVVDGIPEPTPATTYTFYNVTASHTISATFVRQTFTITASSDVNGSIAPSGNVSVNYGDNQTFTFTPDFGYKVSQVLVDGESNPGAALAGAYTFPYITDNHTISVFFAKLTYTITATATAGGTLHPSGVLSVDYNAHSEIYVFEAFNGYHIKKVLVDGVENFQAKLDGLYRFLNVSAHHTLQVFFAPDSHSIFASATQGGEISPTGVVVVPDASDKTFFFTPKTGWDLVRVVIDGVNNPDAVQSGSYTFYDIVESHTIAAQFEQSSYGVFLPTVTGAHIVAVEGSASPVAHGGMFMFEVILEAGYTQSKVTVRSNNLIIIPSGDTYTLKNIFADQYVTVDGVEENPTVGIGENAEIAISIFSYQNMVTILNESLVLVKQVEIMDMYGRVVWQGQTTGKRTEIQLNVATGIYGVRVVKSDNQQVTTKVNIVN